jgi:Phage tail tube protein, GTA-gp10
VLDLAGRRYTLCLTLGALAELEDAFGVADLPALAERFASGRLSARDLLKLLAVALRGGGEALRDEEIAALPLDAGGVETIANALGELLAATLGSAPANPQ